MILFRMHDFRIITLSNLFGLRRERRDFQQKSNWKIWFDISIMPVCSHDPHSTLALYSIYITPYKSPEKIVWILYKQENNWWDVSAIWHYRQKKRWTVMHMSVPKINHTLTKSNGFGCKRTKSLDSFLLKRNKTLSVLKSYIKQSNKREVDIECVDSLFSIF